MVFLDVIVHAITENISNISVKENFEWMFKLKCTQCYTDQPNEITLSDKEQFEMAKGKGLTNFLMKCKDCSNLLSITIYEKSTKRINCENGNDEATLCTFECRGCEIYSWNPCEGIIVESTEGTIFNDVDIRTGEWTDWDEKAKVFSTLISLDHRIEKNKNL